MFSLDVSTSFETISFSVSSEASSSETTFPNSSNVTIGVESSGISKVPGTVSSGSSSSSTSFIYSFPTVPANSLNASYIFLYFLYLS